MLDTLDNVKARLGITESTYDSFLTQQITLISDVIEAYCRRKFLQDDYKQIFYKEDVAHASRIPMFHFPVTAITSIEVDGEVKDVANFRLHKDSGFLTCPTSKFPFGEEMEIVYTAGYATCPSPILAVLDSLVEERYNKKKSGVSLNFGADVQRISIPGAISIDFDYSLANNERKSAYGTILGNNANILDDWRSERAVAPDSIFRYVEEA